MATQVESGPPASARPGGTVTFLFSDIEGSTVRWERDREAMAAALTRHDALMRAARTSSRPWVTSSARPSQTCKKRLEAIC